MQSKRYRADFKHVSSVQLDKLKGRLNGQFKFSSGKHHTADSLKLQKENIPWIIAKR